MEAISGSIVAGVVALIMMLLGGGLSWREIKKHGRTDQKLEEAKKEREDAIREVEIGARPPLTGAESLAVLRKLRIDATK